jgi:hypothetical protein
MVGGQAMAADYFSDTATLSEASFIDGTHWADSCGGTQGTGAITVAAADTFTICDGGTLTLAANATFGGATITVGSGATGVLALGNFTLTMNTAAAVLTNTDTGTITIGSGGISFTGAGTLANGTGTFTAGTGTVAFGGAGTITGTLTLNNVTSTSTLAIPATTATINGNVSIGGNVTGGLKLSAAANHGITATAEATIPTISAAAMTVGQTITFTPPTTAGQAVTVNGFTAPTNPGTGVILTCSGGAVTGATSSPLVDQTGNYICTKSAASTVSAPIFSTKEKPVVFSEEVKH